MIIGLVVVGVLVLLGAIGFVAMTAFNTSESYTVGSCVKQDGDAAKPADCTDSGAFSIVSTETKKEDCADQQQPFVIVENGGKTEVLCLRPAGQK